ncbi:MAG TPA: peptidylprolyl isomerase [Pirellulales bacterium]|nr:peptidylprolyl isomerase [Pirellulales bacterium]
MGFFGFRGKRHKNNKRSSTRRLSLVTRSLYFEPLEDRQLLTVTFNQITGPETNSGYDIPSGKTLYVPLTASDAGQTITYTATTTNSSVTASVLTGNPELVLNVSGTDAQGQAFTGTLTFVLFQDIAPQTVQGIIDDVNNGTFDTATFYRMETDPNFQLIQGGILPPSNTNPTVTGPTLPNEYNANAAFNSPGLLAMAASTDPNTGLKTASTEFFVMGPDVPLAQEPQFLNYGYTIFGQLLSDPSGVYSKILNVPTTAQQQDLDYANTPVQITSASIIESDTQNAVLAISEPAGFTGNATVTVTANGSDNSSKQQSFNVSVVAASAGGAQLTLNPVSNQTTQAGQAIQFTVSANDTVGGTPTFAVGDQDPFSQAPYPAMTNFTVTVTAGANNTATVTLTPKAGFTGTATLVMHADDSSNGLSDAQEFTVTVTGPLTVQTSGATQDVKAGNTLGVTGVSIADPGLPTTANVTTVLKVQHGTLTLPTNVTNGLTAGQIQGNGSGTVTITAPLLALNNTLAATNGLVYTPTTGYGGADGIDITGTDTFGGSNEVTVPLQVLADILINLPSTTPATAMNTAVGITGLSITDPTVPAGDLITLKFQPTNGIVTLSTSVQGGITTDDIQGNGSNSVTVTATLAALNATLAASGGISYTPNASFNGTDNVQVQASDPVDNSTTNNFSVVVGISFTAPTSIEAPSGSFFGISGLSVNDSALSSTGTLSLTIGASQGTLKVSTSVAGGVTNVTGNNSASVTLTGTLAQINATLAATNGVQYKSTVDYTGPDTLTLSATDSLESSNNTGSVALTVMGPLTINTPSAQTIPANTPLALTGISIDDTGIPSTDTVTFVLQATNGVLQLSQTVSGGLTAGQISNNNSGNVTVTGTLDAINATLAAQGGLTYTPNSDFAGGDTITLKANDNATNSDNEPISLLVLGPLTVTVPSGIQAVVAGGTLNVPTITVADPGLDPSADVTVIFHATNGVLNFPSGITGGLVAGEIQNNGTGTVTVTAPLSSLNAQLAASGGFTYTPSSSSFNGPDSISVTASDPTLTQVTQSVSLAVGLTINLPSAPLLPAGQASVISGVSITDPALSTTDTVSIVFSVQSGTLNVSTSVSNGATQVSGNGTDSVTVTGTLAQINATLADAHGLTYTPGASFNGVDTLSASANDSENGSNSEDTTLTVVGPLTVTTSTTQQNIPGGVPQSIPGVSIADPSLPAASKVTVVFTAQHGTLTLLNSVSGGVTDGEIQTNGTATVTVTATLAEINATLAASGGLMYTSASGFSGADALNVQVNDLASNSKAGQAQLFVAGPISVTGPTTTQLVVPGGTLTVTSLSVSDPSLPSGQGVQLVITAAHGTINLLTNVTNGIGVGQITGNGSGTVTINASLAQINATLAATGGVTYTAASGFSGTDAINFAASDTVGNSNSNAPTSVAAAVVGPLNVTGPTGTANVGSSASTPISGFVITDPSFPAASNLTVTLSAGHGTITLLTNVTGGLTAGQISGNGTSNLTITAPLAAINATLAASGGLLYQGISGFSGSDGITLLANDGVSTNASATAALNVIGPVSITAPSTLTANQNNSALVTGLSLADPLLPTSNNVTLTITASHGVVSLSTSVTNGLTSAQITGNGTASVSISAPLAAINATLAAAAGVTYTPTNGVNGPDTLVLTGSDTFSNSTTKNIAVTILPIANSSLSGFVYLDSNLNSAFDASEMGLADVILILQGTDSQNNAVGPLAVKTDSNGSFQFNSLPAGTYTLTKIAPGDLADGHATAGSLGGTVQGNDVIATITLGANGTGTGYNFGENGLAPKFVTLDMFLNSAPTPLQTLINYIDKSYADADISTTAPVGISGKVAPPTISATTSSFTSNQGATLNVTGVQVNDNSLLSTTSNVQVTATVTNGTITVSPSVTGGLSSSQITGSGTSTVTIIGPLATINATLAAAGGLTYTPNATFSGTDSLSLNVSDQGNTATGTPQSGSTSISINVVAAPAITSTSTSLAIATGQTLNVSGVSIADTALTSGANVQLQLGAAHGTINVSTSLSGGVTGAQVNGNGTANVTITAPLAAINAVLAATAGVTYTPTSGYVGSDTFGMTLNDQSNTASGTQQSVTTSLPMSVAGPLAITPDTGTQSLGSNTSLALTGYSLTDPSLPATTNVTMTFQATNGTISLSTAITAGITAGQVTGNGTGTVSITAPLAAINATLAGTGGLTYTPGASFDGSDTVSMTANDSLGNTTTASLTVTS